MDLKELRNILNKNKDSILSEWKSRAEEQYGNKIKSNHLADFIAGYFRLFTRAIDNSNLSQLDEGFENLQKAPVLKNLNLLDITDILNKGRHVILDKIIENNELLFNNLTLLSKLDELFCKLSSRFFVHYQHSLQNALLKEKQDLESRLELNQKFLENILYSTDVAIMTIDENERIANWNKGAEEIFGYKESEVIGKPSSFLMPKEKKFLEELETIKKETSNKGFIKIYETERLNKAGKRIPVQLHVTKLWSSDGRFSRRTVVIKDTSEVKQLRQQISQSEKLAVLGQLAAGVAHEIGNPLTSISSIVQILERKINDETTLKFLSNIKENIDRISRIVRELVDFARTPNYQTEPVQLNSIVEKALEIVKYDKRVKKVEFRTKLNKSLPLIKIVPDQIIQVFVNILINALDAMDGKGTITVTTDYDSEQIFVEIEDTGCGISGEILPKIFDPFFTTKEVGKGTGLGLSVSYGIVSKFGGDIKVKSKVNEGSVFKIELPY